MPRRTTALAASVLTLAGLGVGAYFTASTGSAASLHLPQPGETFTYDVSYNGTSQVTLPDGSSMEARVALAGDLALSGRVQDGDTTVLTATFRELDHAQLHLAGRDLVPDLQDQPVTVAIGPGGELETLYFDPATPVNTRQLMQSLLLDMQVHHPAEDPRTTWRDTNGVLDARWTLDGPTLTRAAEAYTTLTGFPDSLLAHHTVTAPLVVTLDDDGAIETLRGETRLELDGRARIHTTLTARRIAQTHSTTPDHSAERARLARLEPHAPDAVPGRQLAHHNALVGRAGDLTADDLMERLLAGSATTDARFAWQATGLLKLHPELADRLADLHASGQLTGTSADLLVDLLANTGTAEAQEALCSILARPDVQASPGYGRTVQAMVLTPEPTPQTAQFLIDQARAQQGAQARLTRNAAAITASRLAEAGQPALARTLGDDTARLLTATDDPQSEAELLLVLGNLGGADHLDLVLDHTTADEARVRAAAARALRDLDDDDARAELIRLTDDADSHVQVQALRSLDAKAMTDADYDELAERIAAGAIRDGAEEWLLRLAQDDPRGSTLLTAMLERGVESNTLRGKLEAAL